MLAYQSQFSGTCGLLCGKFRHPEVNFLDVNSANFVHIGNFLSHWQFSFTLKIFFHIENFRSHCQISNFAAHFCCLPWPANWPAFANQKFPFTLEISIHIVNFLSHWQFSFTLEIFIHIGNFLGLRNWPLEKRWEQEQDPISLIPLARPTNNVRFV